MKHLPEVVGAMISDGLELLDVLAGSTAGAMASGALKDYLRRRTDKARELLFEELVRGDILPPQAAAKDDAVAIIYHYFRSACMGTARVNLRLLAQAIAGRMRTNTLVADDFLPHAEALASLSREEIWLLATMYEVQSRFPDALPPTDDLQQADEAVQRNSQIWEEIEQSLEAAGWSKDHVQAAGNRSLRSGYVLAGSAWDGVMTFRPSPLLIDLCKTVDFADALRREGLATSP